MPTEQSERTTEPPVLWTDSHCHLHQKDFREPRDVLLKRAREAGVSRFVVIGSGGSEQEAQEAVDIAEQETDVFAAVGIHPHDAAAVISSKPSLPPKAEQKLGQKNEHVPQLLGEKLWEQIVSLCELNHVVAVGETGLDFHYNHSSPQEQEALFRRFVRLAQRLHKPLVLHIRDAHEQAMKMLQSEGGCPRGGVVHCFTGGPKEADLWLALGFVISLSGIVTFPSAQPIQEAAKRIPKESLLLETDCPYLAPVPHRGKRNEPAFLVHTAALVAKLRNESLAELSSHTRTATNRVFGLP